MQRFLGTTAAFFGLLAGAVALGFALFVLLFKLGLLAGIPILFYRGLVLALVAAILTALLLAAMLARLDGSGLQARDAVSAAIVSLSLNVAFLIVVPVTVDRSISVFMLGRLASEPEALRTADEIRRSFVESYVVENRQIERRLEEQLASGNIERVGDTYGISPQGLAFLRAARAAAWLFDADTRFVDPARRGGGGASAVANTPPR